MLLYIKVKECEKKANNMIAYISGTLAAAGENYIIVDNNGIGYKLFVSGKFTDTLPGIGSDIKVHTYMYIREDELTLYGFYSEDELYVFKTLIGISGVGPKAAMSILTALTVNELYMAVMSDDAKTISKANGIGAKGASRIILELKDKLKFEDVINEAYNDSVYGDNDANNTNVVKDVIMALTALGYSSSEAASAVRRIESPESMELEQLLKAALKKLI